MIRAGAQALFIRVPFGGATVVSSPIWQFFYKECLLCQKRPKDSRKNTLNLDETCHCPSSKKLSKHDDQLSSKDTSTSSWTSQHRNDSRTCSIAILHNEQAVDI